MPRAKKSPKSCGKKVGRGVQASNLHTIAHNSATTPAMSVPGVDQSSSGCGRSQQQSDADASTDDEAHHANDLLNSKKLQELYHLIESGQATDETIAKLAELGKAMRAKRDREAAAECTDATTSSSASGEAVCSTKQSGQVLDHGQGKHTIPMLPPAAAQKTSSSRRTRQSPKSKVVKKSPSKIKTVQKTTTTSKSSKVVPTVGDKTQATQNSNSTQQTKLVQNKSTKKLTQLPLPSSSTLSSNDEYIDELEDSDDDAMPVVAVEEDIPGVIDDEGQGTQSMDFQEAQSSDELFVKQEPESALAIQEPTASHTVKQEPASISEQFHDEIQDITEDGDVEMLDFPDETEDIDTGKSQDIAEVENVETIPEQGMASSPTTMKQQECQSRDAPNVTATDNIRSSQDVEPEKSSGGAQLDKTEGGKTGHTLKKQMSAAAGAVTQNQKRKLRSESNAPSDILSVKRRKTSMARKVDLKMLCLSSLDDLTKEDVTSYFSQYGVIKAVSVDGANGLGTVAFETEDEAKLAMEGGSPLLGLDWKIQHTVKSQVITCHFRNLVSSCRSLFVLGLKDLKDDQLSSYFSKYGTVNKVSIVDKSDHLKDKHGVVKFDLPSHCAEAYRDGLIREKSHHDIKGVAVECCVLQGVDEQQSCDLLVTGLAGKLTAKDLQDYFTTKYGDIVNVKVTHDSGFVQFETVKQAEAASNDGYLRERSQHHVDGTDIECQILVNIYDSGFVQLESTKQTEATCSDGSRRDKGEIEMAKSPAAMFKVFVGNVKLLMEKDLEDFFSGFGDIHVIHKKAAHNFCFIEFKHITPDNQKKLIWKRHTIKTTLVDVQLAEHKETRGTASASTTSEDKCKLYLGEVKTLSKGDIWEHFKQHGDVINVKFKKKDGNIIGFVIFNKLPNDVLGKLLGKQVINGVELTVQKQVQYKDVAPSTDEDLKNLVGDTTRMFIGGIGQLTRQQLQDHFSKYGQVTELKVILGTDGRPKGYGFVAFENSVQLLAAYRDGFYIQGKCHHRIDETKFECRVGNQGLKPSPDKDVAPSTDNKDLQNVVGDSKQMFVGGIADLTRQQLQDHFGTYGQVTELRIIMDSDGRPKGYGFVEFETAAQLLAAYRDGYSQGRCYHSIDKIKFECKIGTQGLKGDLRIFWLRHLSRERKVKSMKPSMDIKDLKNLVGDSKQMFVGGIGQLTRQQLQDHFSVYGQVTELKVMTDTDGTPKGYGFVEFETAAQLLAAYQDGYTQGRCHHRVDETKFECKIGNQGINVRESFKQALLKTQPGMTTASSLLMQQQQQTSSLYQLFVGVIGQLTKEQLQDYFSKFGTVEGVNVPHDKQSVSKGYGFVVFGALAPAIEAYQDGYSQGRSCHRIDNKVFECKMDNPDAKNTTPEQATLLYKMATQTQKNTLFVGGIGTSITQQQLNDYFKKFGQIKSVHVKSDNQGVSKGFGFVIYNSTDHAFAAYNSGYRPMDWKSQHCINGVVFDCVLQDEKTRNNSIPPPRFPPPNTPPGFVGNQMMNKNVPPPGFPNTPPPRFPNQNRNMPPMVPPPNIPPPRFPPPNIPPPGFQPPSTPPPRIPNMSFSGNQMNKSVPPPRFPPHSMPPVQNPSGFPGSQMNKSVPPPRFPPPPFTPPGFPGSQMVTEPNELFVGGIGTTITKQLLQDFFSRFGQILDIKIPVDQQGVSKGFGFITFSQPSQAAAAYKRGFFRPGSVKSQHSINGTLFECKLKDPTKDPTKVNKTIPPPRFPPPNTPPPMGFQGNTMNKNVPPPGFPPPNVPNPGGFPGNQMNKSIPPSRFPPPSIPPPRFPSPSIPPPRFPPPSGTLPRLSNPIGFAANQMLAQPTKLFVGGIGTKIGKQQLRDFFSRFGQISEIQIPLDQQGNSKGFGFISFSNPSHAAAAYKGGLRLGSAKSQHSINGTLFECKLQDPTKASGNTAAALQAVSSYLAANSQPSKSNQLFVGGIGQLTKQQIQTFFSRFGSIKDVRVMCDFHGVSKGYAFVTFSYPGAAQKAYSDGYLASTGKSQYSMSGTVFECKIRDPTKQSGNTTSQASPSPAPPAFQSKYSSTLFVGGISDLKKHQLVSYFSKFGPLIDVKVMRHRETLEPMGYAFANFLSPHHSVEAFQKGFFQDGKSRHTIDGVTVECRNRIADPSADKEKSGEKSSSESPPMTFHYKLHMDGISPIRWDTLKTYLSQYGEVKEIMWQRTKEGLPKNHGIVVFKQVSSTEKAFKAGLNTGKGDDVSRHIIGNKLVVLYNKKSNTARKKIKQNQRVAKNQLLASLSTGNQETADEDYNMEADLDYDSDDYKDEYFDLLSMSPPTSDMCSTMAPPGT